jgi:hypothetical protein
MPHVKKILVPKYINPEIECNNVVSGNALKLFRHYL